MQQVMVSVYDVKAEAFSRPTFVRSRGEAERSFSSEVNRAERDNPLYSHSADFALYFVGHFDDSTGRFLMPERPELLCQASSVRLRED